MLYTGTYLGQGRITRSYICPARKNLIFEVDGLDFLQPGTPLSFLDRLQVVDGYALDWFYRQDLTTQRLIVLDTSPYPSREATDAQQLVLRRQDASGVLASGITTELAES